MISTGPRNAVAAAIVLFAMAHNALADASRIETSGFCRDAAQAAEQRFALPAGLLHAISEVETGTLLPGATRLEPWPWTVQAEGNGLHFPTKAAAIDWVEQARARGVASIDVGCMQVNLMFHPAAFANLETAFDPISNANYAARFLVSLRARTGAWRQAIGYYHSQTVPLAETYRRRVESSLASNRIEAPPTPLQQLSLAWSATLDDGGQAPRQPADGGPFGKEPF